MCCGPGRVANGGDLVSTRHSLIKCDRKLSYPPEACIGKSSPYPRRDQREGKRMVAMMNARSARNSLEPPISRRKREAYQEAQKRWAMMMGMEADEDCDAASIIHCPGDRPPCLGEQGNHEFPPHQLSCPAQPSQMTDERYSTKQAKGHWIHLLHRNFGGVGGAYNPL